MTSNNLHDTSQASDRWTTHDRSMSLIFNSHVIYPDYAGNIIDRALEYRDQASESARGALNAAIKDTIDVVGFRDASKAVPDQLKASVMQEVFRGNDRLAGSVLRVWEESKQELRSVVTEHLRSKGVHTNGPDFRKRQFNSIWARREWRSERDEIVEADTDGRFDIDDIGLMVCYVSGRLADPNRVETAGIESELFLEFIDKLDEFPSVAPDWENVDLFINAVTQLAEDKAIDRELTQTLALREATMEVNADFIDDMRYLGLTVDMWKVGSPERVNVTSEALTVINDLKSALAEYSPIRPQADTRAEELQRAIQRSESESVIFKLASRWDKLMSVPLGPEDNPKQLESPDSRKPPERSSVDSPPTTDADAIDAVLAEIGNSDSINPELDRLRQVNDLLSSENAQLRQDSDHLRADVSTLNDQISQFRDELSQSREMQEYWRRTYVSASTGQARDDDEQPAQVVNVSDALALAEKTFPSRLRLALNSKSNKNSPFQKPEEVFDALAWLATEYHRHRSNPGAAPNFDKLIKESCPGWSYKSKQTALTKEQFAEWYTTTLDGKTYELDAHIGKGTSFDPQQTIRIAFDWDNDLRQVIVGFLGRHQRNRRS